MDWRFDFTMIDDDSIDGRPRIGLRVDAVMARTGPKPQESGRSAPKTSPEGATSIVIGRAGRRKQR